MVGLPAGKCWLHGWIERSYRAWLFLEIEVGFTATGYQFHIHLTYQ